MPLLPDRSALDNSAAAPQAIDAVVMWVDGSDPRHRAKLERHLTDLGHRPPAAAPTRFNSVGEIDYCVASLLKFAPYLRRIHIVTDDQVPPVFDASRAWPDALQRKLALVDHREIFAGFEDCLPSFNSRSIAAVLYRIPGLAERFVCLQDDIMLVKPTSAETFFHAMRPVLRGRFETMPARRWSRRLRALWHTLRKPAPTVARANMADSQALSARMAGFEAQYFQHGHNPFPLRRSTFERYFAEHSDTLQAHLRHRLRDASQFAPTTLADHLELKSGQAITAADDQCIYVKPASQSDALARLLKSERDPHRIFACIQSLDQADAPTQAAVLGWLDRVIGRTPAP